MCKRIVSAICLGLVCSVANAGACRDVWDEFVTNPSPENYRKIQEIDDCFKNGLLVIGENTQKELYDLIISKNKYAIDAGFLLMPKLQGGNLEVFFTAIGTNIVDDPTYVLGMFHKYKTPYYAVSSILTMVPYEMIEDYEGRIDLIEMRYRAIRSVDEKDYKNEKADAMNVLKNELDELREIIRK